MAIINKTKSFAFNIQPISDGFNTFTVTFPWLRADAKLRRAGYNLAIKYDNAADLGKLKLEHSMWLSQSYDTFHDTAALVDSMALITELKYYFILDQYKQTVINGNSCVLKSGQDIVIAGNFTFDALTVVNDVTLLITVYLEMEDV